MLSNLIYETDHDSQAHQADITTIDKVSESAHNVGLVNTYVGADIVQKMRLKR